MSLVARKRARNRTVYYVVIQWKGKRYSENAGGDEREAGRLNSKRERERKAGTYVPPEQRQRLTVAAYAELWMAKRTNRTADDDRQRIEDYILTRDWLSRLLLEDVGTRHSKRLVEELNTTGRSHKSIVNIYGAYSRMMRDALLEERIGRDPCALPRGIIQGAPAKRRDPYQVGDAATLCAADKAPATVRLWSLVAFLTGMREGEIAGLNWRDWLPAEPLTALVVDKQYDGRPLKTSDADRCRPRVVPVHPLLAAELAAWKRETWQLVVGRVPTPDDPICPSLRGERHTKSSAYKATMRASVKLGVSHAAKLHAARHSFASWAKREGADRGWLERVTHNSKSNRDALEIYLHPEWPNLCDVVERSGRVLSRVLSGKYDAASELGGGAGNRIRLPHGDTGGNKQSHGESTGQSLSAKASHSLSGGAERAARQHFPPAAAWALALAAERLLGRAA